MASRNSFSFIDGYKSLRSNIKNVYNAFEPVYNAFCIFPDIIIQCNLKITNYLDITLNLNDSLYRPYTKPNEETNYLHINLDHPP